MIGDMFLYWGRHGQPENKEVLSASGARTINDWEAWEISG